MIGYDGTRQDRTGHDRTAQDRTGHNRIEQNRTGQDRMAIVDFTKLHQTVFELYTVLLCSIDVCSKWHFLEQSSHMSRAYK